MPQRDELLQNENVSLSIIGVMRGACVASQALFPHVVFPLIMFAISGGAIIFIPGLVGAENLFPEGFLVETPVASLFILPFLNITFGVVVWLLIVMVVYLTAAFWDNEPLSVKHALSKIKPAKLCGLLGLVLYISIAGAFLLMLFIVPGLVFWLRRSLSFYCYLLEDTSICNALRQSKCLMAEGRKGSRACFFSPPLRLVLELHFAVLLINLSLGAIIVSAIGIGIIVMPSSVPDSFAFGLLLIATSVFMFLKLSVDLFLFVAMTGLYKSLAERLKYFRCFAD